MRLPPVPPSFLPLMKIPILPVKEYRVSFSAMHDKFVEALFAPLKRKPATPPSIEEIIKCPVEAGVNRGTVQQLTDDVIADVHKYCDPYRANLALAAMLRHCYRFANHVGTKNKEAFEEGYNAIRANFEKLRRMNRLLNILTGICWTVLAYQVGESLALLLSSFQFPFLP